jgi:HSP20 family protein
MTYYFTSRPRTWRRILQNPENEQPASFRLPVNVREEDNAYALSAIVPGLTAEDLQIEVIENVITIKGEYKSEDSNFLLREIPSGKFSRSLRMPSELDAGQARAEINHGLLTVRVPKAEHALPKQIKISAN